MNKYKVTIKVTETYTYDACGVKSPEDAIAEAFHYRYLWFRKPDEEYSATTEYQEQEVD